MTFEADTQPTTHPVYQVNTPPCTAWELVLPIEGTGICSGVSAVEFKGKLYVFYTLEKNLHHFTLGYLVLIKNRKNRLIVESQHELPATDSSRLRPAVTVYDGHVFCFFTDRNNTINYLVYSGTAWSPIDRVPHVLTSDSPSVASHGSKLYLALKGTQEYDFYHKIFENFSWGDHIQSHAIQLKGSPSICLYNGQPHVAFKGKDDRQYVAVLIDHEWHGVFRSSQTDTAVSPSLQKWNNTLIYATHTLTNRHYATETVLPAGAPRDDHTTTGTYLSPPCLVNYMDELYLVGQRPCNDIGISLFDPTCS